MGLLKAAAGSIGSNLVDQWRDYFYCDALQSNIMVVKAKKRVAVRSSNTKGDENIITTGSVIAVADGQCMITVEQGKILDVCSDPGEFYFDSGGVPSLFTGGDLGANAIATLRNIWERFKFGGQPGMDTRVYYINTKELIGNKYGTPNPIPFRVVDANIGLDLDIAIRCFGEFSYRITNPILFYINVSGNVSTAYVREMIDEQLRAELMTALQPTFATISAMGIRYSALPGHTLEVAQILNDVLSDKWRDLRGLEIVSFGISSVTASKEDEEMIKNLQKSAVMRDPGMAAAMLAEAQADAMRSAASNEAIGPMFAFAGMNMAANAGGMNAQNLFTLQQTNQVNPTIDDKWTCVCEIKDIIGNFCSECGQSKPAPPVVDKWICSCGNISATGKFCSVCGNPRPEDITRYKCDKCGWESPDSTKIPKFCTNCGNSID
jgi:membrane protease subunit (stomatin/prohibitin family)